jgi:hypothetical protein
MESKMTPAREEATKLAIKLLSMFDGYNDSVKETEMMLNDLSDKDFDAFMTALAEGKDYLPYILPTMGKIKMSTARNLEIAEKIGHQFFHRLWLTDPASGEVYLTPKRYLVMDLPLRRQQQHLQKKIRIPESNKSVDDMTGQVTGDSKGASISFPELQILYSQGLEQTIRELFKFRGGDEEAYKALNRDAMQSGVPSMDAVDTGNTRPQSTETLGILLKSMHLNNNI